MTGITALAAKQADKGATVVIDAAIQAAVDAELAKVVAWLREQATIEGQRTGVTEADEARAFASETSLTEVADAIANRSYRGDGTAT